MTKADVRTGPYSMHPHREGGAQDSPDTLRLGKLTLAEFNVDQAMRHTYPEVMPAVNMEVDGETPEHAAEAARTTSPAAAQLVRETVRLQNSEVN